MKLPAFRSAPPSDNNPPLLDRVHSALMDRACEILPFSPDQLTDTFFADFRSVIDHLGDHVESLNLAENPLGITRISHAELSLSLALEAARLVLSKRGRRNAWSNSYDGDSDLAWSRAAWRCALIAPLGYLIADHAVVSQGNQYHWAPSAVSLDAFLEGSRLTVDLSNRHLSGASEAHGIFRFLFCAHDQKHPHFILLAVSNAFSDRSDKDNPISWSVRKAAKLVAPRDGFSSCPYWWKSFFKQYAGLSDVSPFESPGPRLPPVSKSSQTRTQHEPIQVVSGVVPLPEKPSSLSSSHDSSHSENPLASDQTRFAEAFFDRLRGLVERGHITCNTKGSIFHVCDGHLHIISPSGWPRCAKLAQLKLDGEELRRLMVLTNHVQKDERNSEIEHSYYICPDGRSVAENVGVMRLVQLSKHATRRLFPNSLPDDNTDLILKPDR